MIHETAMATIADGERARIEFKGFLSHAFCVEVDFMDHDGERRIRIKHAGKAVLIIPLPEPKV